MLLRAFIVVAAAAAVLAPPAGAATASLVDVSYCTDVLGGCRYQVYSAGAVLSYAGEPGERNRVTVTRAGDAIVVSDEGAALRAGAGCIAASAGSARCAFAGRALVGYRVDGGDQADALRLAGALAPAHALGQPRVLAGGPGDDVLVDGADDSLLLGGPGADRLDGGAGDDRFLSSDDRLLPGAWADGAEADAVEGGPGFDTADYRRRTRPLRLQNVGGTTAGGEPGEDDRLTRVEAIVGGAGDDVLVGGARADMLDGWRGADRLDGRGGDDVLVGGGGLDALSGGDGADRLGDGRRIACGRGRDEVGRLELDVEDSGEKLWHGPRPADVVARDCERVRFGFPGPGRVTSADPRPSGRGRRAWQFHNPCVSVRLAACSGRIALALPGADATLAAARFSRSAIVTVALRPPAARALARTDRVAIRISVRATASSPPERTAFVLSIAP